MFFSPRAPKMVLRLSLRRNCPCIDLFGLPIGTLAFSQQISEIEMLAMKYLERMDHPLSAMNANRQVALRALFS